MGKLEIDADRLFLHDGETSISLQNFQECRRGYSGSVFILASGISASDFPVAQYRHLPFIAMNGSILRLAQDKIIPIFYLVDDKGFVESRSEIAKTGFEYSKNVAMSFPALQALHNLFPNLLKTKNTEGRPLYLLERVNSRHKQLSDRAFAWSIRGDTELFSDFSLLHLRPNKIGFSKNMCRGYFCARTIPYVAIQLCYHLGFRNLFIIGMDMRDGSKRFYESGSESLPSRLENDYDGFILPNFKFMAQKILGTKDFQVFNLSSISRIPDEILPKISLRQLDQIIQSPREAVST
jgi:KDO transferase-3